MGDPKFPKRRYDTPSHPWQGDRIKSESELVKRFGLKNKRELWKAQSLLRLLRVQSRDLQARLRTGDKQAELETKELLDRCGRLGLLPLEGMTLNDVLLLNVEDLLARRFQTMVVQKGLAYTPSQARQFIVHGHIAIGDRRMTVPGYIVKRVEENVITYAPNSPILDDLHPAHPKPKDELELEREKVQAERETSIAKEKEEEKKQIKKVEPSIKKAIDDEPKDEIEKEAEESKEPEEDNETEKKAEEDEPKEGEAEEAKE